VGDTGPHCERKMTISKSNNVFQEKMKNKRLKKLFLFNLKKNLFASIDMHPAK